MSLLGFTVPPWYARALCRTTPDPEIFYPNKGNPARTALDTCRACPVRKLCLADAIARGERHGIWGGLSERQRRRFTRGDGRRALAVAETGRLGALGVTAADVREWAYEHGITRNLATAGRLPQAALVAYEAAHPIIEQEEPA